jgi:acetyl-CoA synthetase
LLQFTGDGAGRDHEGYYWIRGRVDDVVNVSGHRLSTAEIEAALIEHHSVAEAAVVGIADELTGQAVNAFVALKNGDDNTDQIKKDLVLQVRKRYVSLLYLPNCKPLTISLLGAGVLMISMLTIV